VAAHEDHASARAIFVNLIREDKGRQDVFGDSNGGKTLAMQTLDMCPSRAWSPKGLVDQGKRP